MAPATSSRPFKIPAGPRKAKKARTVRIPANTPSERLAQRLAKRRSIPLHKANRMTISPLHHEVLLSQHRISEMRRKFLPPGYRWLDDDDEWDDDYEDDQDYEWDDEEDYEYNYDYVLSAGCGEGSATLPSAVPKDLFARYPWPRLGHVFRPVSATEEFEPEAPSEAFTFAAKEMCASRRARSQALERLQYAMQLQRKERGKRKTYTWAFPRRIRDGKPRALVEEEDGEDVESGSEGSSEDSDYDGDTESIDYEDEDSDSDSNDEDSDDGDSDDGDSAIEWDSDTYVASNSATYWESGSELDFDDGTISDHHSDEDYDADMEDEAPFVPMSSLPQWPRHLYPRSRSSPDTNPGLDVNEHGEVWLYICGMRMKATVSLVE